MKEETLKRAMLLKEDIQQMEFALSYYKRGRWSHWGINDSADLFHFVFCKNWAHREADMQGLPTWLNKPLMEVIEREMNRCKRKLETLTDDNVDAQDDFVLTDEYNPETKEVGVEEVQLQKKNGPTVFFKLFWSLVLAIILIGTSSLCVAFTCYAIGDSFDMQTLAYSVLFSTVWLASYILIDKNEQ